jgi:hypothetical protein
MKTSQNHKLQQFLAAGVIGLAAFVSVPAVQAEDATPTTQTYKPWAGATGQQLKSLITDLKTKIAAAEKSEAASPDFLADLKALVAKYEALQTSGQGQGSGMAPGTQVFTDTFADGNYTASPTWKVSAGVWTVDPSGTNKGLNSKVRPQKLNINNVLGALLNSQGSTNQNQFASIYTPAKIPNAFALKVTLTSKDKQGALNLGVYQGASGATMYRMVYQPGAAPGIAIQKVTSAGATTLGSYNSVVNLEDGSPHTLIFSRDAQGSMKVTLDDQSVATAKDTSLTGDMTGLLFINSGGAYYMREVTVTSN